MKKTRKTEGITLVALVITIILLLILAGITINSLVGSGLFEKAQLAKEKTDASQTDENEKLKEYEDILNGQIDGSRDTETVSREEYDKLKNKVEQLETNYKNKVEQLETELINYKNKFDDHINLEWTLINSITTANQWVEVNTQIDEYDYIAISVYATDWGDINQCVISVKDLKERYNSTNKTIGVDATHSGHHDGGSIYFTNGKLYANMWRSNSNRTFNIYGIK